MSDEHLVAEASRGEVEALSALYDRYHRLMFTTAMRMLGDSSSAEDLVQDVFMEVWRHASTFDRSRGTVRTWMLIRLRSRGLDRLRSASHRRVESREDLDRPQDLVEDPAFQPDRSAVRRALAKLPDHQRQVLELSYFEGLSAREIATQVGLPVGTVKSRTAAGLAKLRASMAPTPSPPSGGPQ